MNPISSYADVIGYIAQEISKLSLNQKIIFVKALIYKFVEDLPVDWLDAELDIEKPHFQILKQQITAQTWDVDIILQQLDALDDIMFSMGDAYPHSTSDALLLLLDMLGFYLSLAEAKEQSEFSEEWTILCAQSYLDYYDYIMEETSAQNDAVASSFDNWLEHPLIQTAFNKVNDVLIVAKNN